MQAWVTSPGTYRPRVPVLRAGHMLCQKFSKFNVHRASPVSCCSMFLFLFSWLETGGDSFLMFLGSLREGMHVQAEPEGRQWSVTL